MESLWGYFKILPMASGKLSYLKYLFLLFLSIGFFANAPVRASEAGYGSRTLTLYHIHTKDWTVATFRRNGRYDLKELQKLNYALRDWRTQEVIEMDPQLFDLVWEIYQASGSRQPIVVMSAYRSPSTNAMLRRTQAGVAKHSQHMSGKALDFHLSDVPIERLQAIALQRQGGGLGYYPHSGRPFIHVDTGQVRHWPRMEYAQLARLFPNGQTLHVAADGRPLPGYALARSKLSSEPGAQTGNPPPSLWARFLKAFSRNPSPSDSAPRPSLQQLAGNATPSRPQSLERPLELLSGKMRQSAENNLRGEQRNATNKLNITPNDMSQKQLLNLISGAQLVARFSPVSEVRALIPLPTPRPSLNKRIFLTQSSAPALLDVPLPAPRPQQIMTPTLARTTLSSQRRNASPKPLKALGHLPSLPTSFLSYAATPARSVSLPHLLLPSNRKEKTRQALKETYLLPSKTSAEKLSTELRKHTIGKLALGKQPIKNNNISSLTSGVHTAPSLSFKTATADKQKMPLKSSPKLPTTSAPPPSLASPNKISGQPEKKPTLKSPLLPQEIRQTPHENKTIEPTAKKFVEKLDVGPSAPPSSSAWSTDQSIISTGIFQK